MAINRLEQQAFMSSSEFMNQVESIWLQEIMAALTTLSAQADLDESEEQKLQSYKEQLAGARDVSGMMQLIVADAGWTTTYSTWATSPDKQDGAIRAGIQKMMSML